MTAASELVSTTLCSSYMHDIRQVRMVKQVRSGSHAFTSERTLTPAASAALSSLMVPCITHHHHPAPSHSQAPTQDHQGALWLHHGVQMLMFVYTPYKYA